jgi:hypothetical protein
MQGSIPSQPKKYGGKKSVLLIYFILVRAIFRAVFLGLRMQCSLALTSLFSYSPIIDYG